MDLIKLRTRSRKAARYLETRSGDQLSQRNKSFVRAEHLYCEPDRGSGFVGVLLGVLVAAGYDIGPEFTREDLVTALNEMVLEYKKLSKSLEEVKAERDSCATNDELVGSNNMQAALTPGLDRLPHYKNCMDLQCYLVIEADWAIIAMKAVLLKLVVLQGWKGQSLKK
ncbi:hypothetical protein F511_11754 [Dorcoceras hygrometricum]|uniref:Uncharacterized protein n=1 Tax=Dorcoceras hygrometricum TaxID=472368 RepID=A0A2Z7B8T4_9LAMI|nr:hypothetical protein F511_11754 [Dorcoceras hygrometricum]